MQDYERRTIKEVVDEINKTYFLPDIQRSFVWKPDQVYVLFDSILRDYPIGTFLFWKQKGEYLEKEKIKKLEFVKMSQDKNTENTEFNSAKEYCLILDGQQRLTTFFLVLKGNYIIRNNRYDLYFNILSGNVEQEDGILFEFKFFNSKKGKSFVNYEEKIQKLWYRVKSIYDLNPEKIFTEIPKLCSEISTEYAIELTNKQQNTISTLWNHLKNTKVVYYYPEVEQDYDKVLDIFVRTNAGGTFLSYSDLLFSTIKSKWGEARTKFDSLLSNINDGGVYRFTNDFILKTALLLYAKNNEEIRYKTKNFKTSLIKNLENDWNEIEKAITTTIDLLKDKSLLSSHKIVSSNNSIIPIIYWVFKNGFKGFGSGSKLIKDTEINKIRIWLTKALLAGIFGGQSDTILYKCKEAIDRRTDRTFSAEDIENVINKETTKSMKLDDDFIDGVLYDSSESYLVLSVCYKGTINFHPRSRGNLPEQDHIFSQNELEKAKIPAKKINSIYNIRYIGSDENKHKSNTPYAEWIKELEKNSTKDIEMKKHLIPKGQWSTSNFDNFLNERKKLIKANFNYD